MINFHDIVGQETAKRAIEIALAGGHQLLLTGPTGCGKTMLIHAGTNPDLYTGADLAESRELATVPELNCYAMHVAMAAVPACDLALPPPAEDGSAIWARISAARSFGVKLAKRHGERLDKNARELLFKAAERMKLTARAWFATIEVGATIANLEGSPTIRRQHIAEAISYRPQEPEDMT